MLREGFVRNNRFRPQFASPRIPPRVRPRYQRPIPVIYQPRKPRGNLTFLRHVTRQKRLTLAGLATISTEILNLVEQFVVFAQIRDNDSSDFQFRFLLIATVIAFFNLVKCIFSSRRVRICVSIAIDSGEFITYYALLQRKTSLFVVTGIFYGVELALHLINLFITGETIQRKKCFEKIIDLGVQLVMFFFSNTLPFMTLFMKDRTEFRKDYFEYLLILYLFLGTAGIEVLSEIATKQLLFLLQRVKRHPRPRFYDISKNEVAVVQIFSWIKFALAIAINFLTMPILIFVISIVQLSKYGDTLARYDRNCYIIFISFIGFYFLLMPLFIWLFVSFVKFCIRDYSERH